MQEKSMTTETKTVSTSIQGAEDKLFTLEAGRMARLAGGAVIASMGRTQVLVTATGAK